MNDEELSEFLGSEIPEPQPGTWERIDARLEAIEAERAVSASSEATFAKAVQTDDNVIRLTDMNTQPQTHRSRRTVLLAMAAAVAVVAGVLGLITLTGTETTNTADDSDSLSTTTTAAPSTTTTAPQSTTETEDTPVLTPGESGSFVSPSGNISCVINEVFGVSCHVLEHEWTIESPTEADCEFDWGDNVSLTPDGIEYGCYSDVYWDLEAEVLPYGSAIQVDGFDCKSERTGITCFNSVDDGFTIARANLEIFEDNS